MSDTPFKRLPSAFTKIISRVLPILVLAVLVGWMLNRISLSLSRSARPAGFVRGMVQGALMPMSMPNLLVGNDVIIYATHNTGLTYKLGYTMGVNLCGTIVFGAFFLRVSRWKAGKKVKVETQA